MNNQIKIVETITWTHVSVEVPDTDILVMASHPSWPYESWPCYLDTEGTEPTWRFDGGQQCAPQPTLWTDLPRGASVETNPEVSNDAATDGV